jgi:hypothetical protein
MLTEKKTTTRVASLLGAALLLLLVDTSNVTACTCGHVGRVYEEYEEASAVFVGTVTSIDRLEPWWRSARRQWTHGLYTQIDQLPGWLSKEIANQEIDGTYGLDVTFDVRTAWKGVRDSVVTVRTGFGGGDCGFPFEEGRQYRVYAFRGADATVYYEQGPWLSTSICSRTMTETSARLEESPPAQPNDFGNFVEPGFPDECKPLETLAEEYEKASTVFSGKVISVQDPSSTMG